MTTPNAARVKKVGAKKLAAGLKQVRSLWALPACIPLIRQFAAAHPDDMPAIIEYAATLARKRARQHKEP